MSYLARVGLLCLVAVVCAAKDWDARRAADYMDARQEQWAAWGPAAAAPGGACVSCHTGGPYLLARPALRARLSETAATKSEEALLAGFRSRIQDGQRMFRGTNPDGAAVDAVSAAFYLAVRQPEASETLKAFDNMWKLQIREGAQRGAWPWFQLKLGPWEAEGGAFYGATIAAAAVGAMPASYRDRADVRERFADLLAYLKREAAGQPLHHRVQLLWASKWIPEAAAGVRKEVIAELKKTQRPDGGWAVESMGPWRFRSAAGSDSYATAFAATALLHAGAGKRDKTVRAALQWLRAHQDPATGAWDSRSMNKEYPAGSMQSGFMRDAATSYAVMALTAVDRR